MTLTFALSACGTDTAGTGSSFAPPSADAETAQTEVTLTPMETETPTVEDTDNATDEDSNVLEIGEQMFIAQINDIYYNFDDYADKTIIVEGMYAIFYAWDETISSPGVYRNGPGCCGNDGWGGFMLNYDGELPQDNDWIRVTGTPELVTAADGYVDLFLNVIELEVMDVRGAEFVSQ